MASGLPLPDENLYVEEYRQFRTRVAELKGAWEAFQRSGEAPEGTVRPEVLASWRRCRARGLDPYGNPNLTALSPGDLQRRREANRLLIEAAAPFLETLAQSVRGSGFRIDLFDRELYILAQYGDEKALAEAAALGSGPGVNRGEGCAGTNAINLAAHLRRPVQLVGPEHYNATLHYWTCSAVPVFSPRKDLIAVINVAGHFSLLHKHTLGMAIAVG
ncbi:MAG: sigma-54-dependent Fis family transcriptional regulator, partial [Firmicutes bacterium]|nr:sigma-54-dependent Fis family transcriptional regulator [Bacillota bacterium]